MRAARYEYILVRDFHPDMWPALKKDGWEFKRQFTAREDYWPFDHFTVTEFRRFP